ncbi:MAG: SLOG family protein [Faecalibacterium sp.]|nr:SLOG family protein [Ruminococcus sp.]MCM1392584.1 SLOG family protein [Ruminococcus sp.]MCM1486276.1 SLOG family protein [Faecalibacterium sp.]
MKNQTACFTGHRYIPQSKIKSVQIKLINVLEELIAKGYRYFGAGGALGFDTLAAQTVLDLMGKHPQIKLILVLPCISQADRWNINDKQMYESIKKRADKIVYTSKEYTNGCMHKRNQHLIDNSSVCICYLTKAVGGTAYTVNYAEMNGLNVINTA